MALTKKSIKERKKNRKRFFFKTSLSTSKPTTPNVTRPSSPIQTPSPKQSEEREKRWS
jgi:hypothetical protein